MDVLSWPSTADASRELNVSPNRVHQLIRAGKLRVVVCRLGYLIDPASIAEYAVNRKPWPGRVA
ncbi:MAG TPA: helix-turn-helix domain-containing protein [Ktedonobacterales bacterium]